MGMSTLGSPKSFFQLDYQVVISLYLDEAICAPLLYNIYLFDTTLMCFKSHLKPFFFLDSKFHFTSIHNNLLALSIIKYKPWKLTSQDLLRCELSWFLNVALPIRGANLKYDRIHNFKPCQECLERFLDIIVEIIKVFPSPTGYMLTSFGFYLLIEVYFLDSF